MSTTPTNNQNNYSSTSSSPPQIQTTQGSPSNQYLLQLFLQQKNITGLDIKFSNNTLGAPNRTISATSFREPPRTINALLDNETRPQLPTIPSQPTVPLSPIVDLSDSIPIQNSLSPFKIESTEDLVLLFNFLENYINYHMPDTNAPFEVLLNFLPSRIELQMNHAEKKLSLKFKDIDPGNNNMINVIETQMKLKYKLEHSNRIKTKESIPFNEDRLNLALSTFDKVDQNFLLQLCSAKYNRPRDRWHLNVSSNFRCTIVYQILNSALNEIMKFGKLHEIVPDTNMRTALESIFCILQFKYSESDICFNSFQQIYHFIDRNSQGFEEYNSLWIYLRLEIESISSSNFANITVGTLNHLVSHFTTCLRFYSYHLAETKPTLTQPGIQWRFNSFSNQTPPEQMTNDSSILRPEQEESLQRRKKQRTESAPVPNDPELGTSETTVSSRDDSQPSSETNSAQVKEKIAEDEAWLKKFLG